MKEHKEQVRKLTQTKMDQNKFRMDRRTILKALAGIPILGVFAYQVFEKLIYEQSKKTNLLKILDLNKIQVQQKDSKRGTGKLIRIGFIGFGSRAVDLANGLGFMHPLDMEHRRQQGTLEEWISQENLNVAVTGVCDVFDLHAKMGIETFSNEMQAGGKRGAGLSVKRYLRYEDMLNDKDIDAVFIATPDHHHARMAIDAAKAGKHIYCEKSPCINETELHELYDTVKNSAIVYQLGHQISQSEVFKQAKEIIRKGILGKITLVETTSNRNTADGAWIRNLDEKGNPKPGDLNSIDWKQWLGKAPEVPFSLDRYYNWTKWFDYDIGMLGQLFTHEYDAVNQLLNIGIPKSAVASGGIYFWKDNREIPDLLNVVFEYPNKDLTLLYSATLENSRQRGRIFMGNDASMELGSSVKITVDGDSARYKKLIAEGIVDPSVPMLSFDAGSDEIDARTSATEKYYASRGLTTTYVDGRKVDVTHLHIKEWIDCIRYGGMPTANIDRAFEEGVTIIMGHRAYLEGRKVEWDAERRKIV